MRIRIVNAFFTMVLMAGVAFAQTAAGQEPDEAHAEHHPEETEAQVAAEPAEAPDMMARCRQMMAELTGWRKSSTSLSPGSALCPGR